MHRKIFPNKNRKTRLLENQLQLKLKNPNSGYGENRFGNDETTGVDAPQHFSKQKSQDASIGNQLQQKLKNPNSGHGKNRFSDRQKPQESMHRKIFPNKNRKMRLLENQLQQKLKNPNSGYGRTGSAMTNPQESMHRKILSSYNLRL